VELASRKLVLDQPVDGVARLRISNAERRGALDHEILDALAETARVERRLVGFPGSGRVASGG
jgi:hypothetical protein